MISWFKKIVPSFFKEKFRLFVNRPIYNVFDTSFKKKALISYITLPFRKNSLRHTNYFEVKSAADIFHNLGYQVDVIHYEDSSPKLDSYDVIYGFGDVFRVFFETPHLKATTIYYGAGMHVCHQNNAGLQRVKDVYEKKGIWLAASARFVEKTWTHQTCLVDSIIALGNDVCKASYQKYYEGAIFSVPAPFFQVLDPENIISQRASNAHKNFLWFGSSGLIHKGLDICLDYFKSNPDLSLHVCGDIDSEKNFVKYYHNELFESPNIHCHGFVDILSNQFLEILSMCSFVIFPSCSEGGSPSVLTVVGNGGLVPVITTETTVSTGYEITIEELSEQGVKKAIEYTQTLSDKEIGDLQKKNYQYVIKENSKKNYYKVLKKAIQSITKYDEL